MKCLDVYRNNTSFSLAWSDGHENGYWSPFDTLGRQIGPVENLDGNPYLLLMRLHDRNQKHL